MPGTPATTPRFGAPRIANTDTFDLARDHNGLADALDLAAKFTSSLSSARPASPVVDQYNYSTDTNVLERWSGTAWVRPTPAPHASSHQDGGTDALTVREAMMVNGALGPLKGAFRAYRNAAVSLTNSAVVPFDTETLDASNWFDVTTNVGRYTPQVAGWFWFSWTVAASVGSWTAGTYLQAALFKNGVNVAYGSGVTAPNAAGAFSVGSDMQQANGTTDFFDIRFLQNTGAAQAVAVGSTQTHFQGHLIGRS